MIVSGRRAISPRYIRDIRIEEDEEGVMLRVVATMQGGAKWYSSKSTSTRRTAIRIRFMVTTSIA